MKLVEFNKETILQQEQLKQQILDTFKSKQCFVSEITWESVCFDSDEMVLTVRYNMVDEIIEDTAFEDAMDIVE